MALTKLAPVKAELVEVIIVSLDDSVFLRKLLIRDKLRLSDMTSPKGDKLKMTELKGATVAVALCDADGKHLYAGTDIDEFLSYFTEEQLDELYQAFLAVNPVTKLEDKKK